MGIGNSERLSFKASSIYPPFRFEGMIISFFRYKKKILPCPTNLGKKVLNLIIQE